MPIGITNTTNVSLEDINSLTNFTNIAELYININEVIYGGWMIFLLLVLLWGILWKSAQDTENQPLVNAVASGTAVTVLSFFIRGIQILILGVKTAMITDQQLWVFPLVTILLATAVWIMKKD